MTIHLRADRAVFRFGGPEAHKLLNDVVTGHIPAADEGVAAPWALLSPQGKILAEGLAGWNDEALWLDVHESVADDFFKRMRMYRLRAKVDIDDLRATHRVGFSDGADLTGIVHRDRVGPVSLGSRVIASAEEAAHWAQDDRAYQQRRIAGGIAHQGNDFPANDIFAHDIGLDLLDAIDFDKGCYVGQEVVSRMKHRGTARRRPVIVSGVEAEPGTAVVAGGREAGTIGQVDDGKAVAILRLDRITDPSAVTVNDKPVGLTLPPWASYHFGDSVPED
ncbi:YgfZ/GcvT domain-containing protein [Devosia albogilva]|uniref:YgfZ/GcvT domain-containing protein n=1 Tax=Devosia albogilva TaxID=429726 RepID=A0ABW5QM95_9HYPH